MTFTHTIRVRYGEVDAQRVVFNAYWLAYVDDTMTRYFEHLGWEPQETWLGERAWDVMLRHAELDWVGGAGFDDRVDITVRPSRLGNSSFDLTYEAAVDGGRRFTAVVTYVVIDPAAGRPRPIPDDVRAALEAETG